MNPHRTDLAGRSSIYGDAARPVHPLAFGAVATISSADEAATFELQTRGVAYMTGLVRQAASVDPSGAAFDQPLQATCMHEAGHAVMQAAGGSVPTRCWIRCQAGQWIGMTEFALDSPMRTAAASPALAIWQAMNLLAGVRAERLFAAQHYRAGSSLDEVASAMVMCDELTRHAGFPSNGLWAIEILTDQVLIDNAAAVRRLGDELAACHRIKARRLERLLADVPRAWPEDLLRCLYQRGKAAQSGQAAQPSGRRASR